MEALSSCSTIFTEGILVTASGTIVGVLSADMFSSGVDVASICTRGIMVVFV